MGDREPAPRYHRNDYRTTPRFDVTRADDGSYAVLGLGSYPSIAEAFRAILDHGGRAHLTWARTVIGGGEVGPRDFSASFYGAAAGRIYAGKAFGETVWRAFAGGHNRATNRMGGATGLYDDRDGAVAFIEYLYTDLMADDR